MSTDPFVQFKATQKEGWGLFTPVEIFTTMCAGHLVNYAGIRAGQAVLDVACGTGVVSVTAARTGAKVSGLDLSPVLIERGAHNAAIAGVPVDFKEGDAEALPYADGAFDVVVSQFGHMFAPRPEVAIAEMLRVLKPGGRIAFSTWPPELLTGRMFSLVNKHMPPPPPDAPKPAPPPMWGDPNVVRERLGDKVTNLEFMREELRSPSMSVRHSRNLFETTLAPLVKLLKISPPDKIEAMRAELDALLTDYYDPIGNVLRQHFLMSRGFKRA